MAGIFDRATLLGTSTRVKLQRKGSPVFHLTFENRDDAVQWVKEHELEYYKDPDKYIKWKEDLYFKAKKSGMFTYNGIILKYRKY